MSTRSSTAKSRASLASARKRTAAFSGISTAAGEVVALDPLAEEVGIVARGLVAEQEVPERLQQNRPGRVRAYRLLPHVDAVIAQVREGPDRTWQVLDVPDGETVVADHRQQHALGQGTPGVARGLQRPVGGLLDVLEVIGPLAHGRAQLGVGGARLLRRRRRPGPLLMQRAGQLDQMLQYVGRDPGAHLEMRQAELGVGGIALRFLEGDLELGPAAGGLAPQQFLDRHRQRGSQVLQHRQLRLAAAVLQQRERRRGAADPVAQLGQGQATGPAQMPEPLTHGHKV